MTRRRHQIGYSASRLMSASDSNSDADLDFSDDSLAEEKGSGLNGVKLVRNLLRFQ